MDEFVEGSSADRAYVLGVSFPIFADFALPASDSGADEAEKDSSVLFAVTEVAESVGSVLFGILVIGSAGNEFRHAGGAEVVFSPE